MSHRYSFLSLSAPLEFFFLFRRRRPFCEDLLRGRLGLLAAEREKVFFNDRIKQGIQDPCFIRSLNCIVCNHLSLLEDDVIRGIENRSADASSNGLIDSTLQDAIPKPIEISLCFQTGALQAGAQIFPEA